MTLRHRVLAHISVQTTIQPEAQEAKKKTTTTKTGQKC